jgi:hemerythrin-like domain-containing protein/nucleotide-binding universal stress UspA family protein
MYQHLWVPVDGTEASVVALGQALELARCLKARITFVHARAEDADEDAAADRAGEYLAKAEAAARASGVPCSVLLTSVQAMRDVIAAARERGRDLIFVGVREDASSPDRSPLTEALAQLRVARLLSPSAVPAVAVGAVGIIRDEHRSLASVLHVAAHTVRQARARGAMPDLDLLQAVVRYIQRYSIEWHHPREECALFHRLRERTSILDAELGELERQHEREGVLVHELEGLLEGNPNGTQSTALEWALERYTAFTWAHLGREEGVILPAALRLLTPADWAGVEAALAAAAPPRLDGDADSRRLLALL